MAGPAGPAGRVDLDGKTDHEVSALRRRRAGCHGKARKATLLCRWVLSAALLGDKPCRCYSDSSARFTPRPQHPPPAHHQRGKHKVELVQAPVGAGGHVADDRGRHADDLLNHDLVHKLRVGGHTVLPALPAKHRLLLRLVAAVVAAVAAAAAAPAAARATRAAAIATARRCYPLRLIPPAGCTRRGTSAC